MEKYANYTDEQLVNLFKEGEQAAFDEINKRYKMTVRAEANKYFLQGGNKDDLLQEGTIGLAKAVNGYDGKGAFKAYACKCIKNNVINAIATYSKKSNTPLNDGISLDNVDAKDMQADDPLVSVIESETTEEFIQNAKSKLSKTENVVLDYALEGYSYTEIAEKTGKKPKSVDNTLQRIRNKLLR